MIASAAAVASAEGLGCFAAGLGRFAAGLGRFLQSWQASGRAGWLLCCRLVVLDCRLGRPPVGLEGFCSPPSLAFVRKGEAKDARQFAREGKGEQSDAAISAGLIHENQPTVCKGTAFSWNKYQK